MDMRATAALILAATLGMGAVGCDDDSTGPGPGGGPITAGPFDWQGDIAQGNHIEIKGVAGDIRVESSTGSQVEVAATRTGIDNDPNEVTLDVVTHGEGVTICAVYPHPTGGTNSCVPGMGGDMSTGNNDVVVDFSVKVPDGVDFVGRVVAGSVEVLEIEGDIVAVVIAGEVNVSTSGVAEATVTSGPIFASMGSDSWDRGLAFGAAAGSITVEVPATLDAEVEAATATGTITSQFPITITSVGAGATGAGQLGAGGHLLRLTTAAGDIALNRRN